MPPAPRASTARLGPGEDSIDRARPTTLSDGTIRLIWRIQVPGEAKPRRQTTKGPSAGVVRRRARAKAESILASTAAGWTPSDALFSYIDQVVRPALEADPRLAPSTRSLYMRALGRIDDRLGRQTIASAMTYRALEGALQAVAAAHGAEAARQARTVLSSRLIPSLLRDDLISHHPLAGIRIDLSTGARPRRPDAPVGGVALSRDQYARCLSYLLDLDPTTLAPTTTRSRWTVAEQVAVREATIATTLLQATTGLRISEARQLAWSDARLDPTGTLWVTVPAELSKTRRGRTVPILAPRVAGALLARRDRLSAQHRVPAGRLLLIGSPTDPTRPWDGRNARQRLAELYVHLAERLDIPELERERTHVWRATLNGILSDAPAAVRAAAFGHSEQVNQRSYTDGRDLSQLADIARDVLGGGLEK
ncbi:tyrosine-type recombinase/integrase [Micrococcus sp. FDAARGOS_333]|uniref:tyrosine-type recombinase/integrase n=1 Tax=Micrococcus sp. FDAARGOS_333 TaxID=1930558 RepID=UPI000B4E73D5|nr:tyrosine-type recombinase/integrase [Micrococcus sp. FDAARGOS_333]PNL17597.1 hypothetical protein CEQ11_005285 [Micrococcus sp. FDAARGOS_333]